MDKSALQPGFRGPCGRFLERVERNEQHSGALRLLTCGVNALHRAL